MSETPNRIGGGTGPTVTGLVADPADPSAAEQTVDSGEVSIGTPRVSDAASLWRIAKDSGALDLNSSYAYLLWSHDFAATSVVARNAGGVVGFVTGYLRPAAQDTLMVWQVAVDASCRGKGVAAALLDGLLDRVVPMGVRYLETTVTADNDASNRMFRSLAARRSADIERSALFESGDFPDGHDTEFRYRIGPL
jgi:L-2,4-diaminobutyric acid acetyltransferase